MKTFSCVSLAFLTVIFACKKSDDQTSILQKWQVDGFLEHIDSVAQYPTSSIFIEFKSDKTFSIQLEANKCSGTFNKAEKKLSIEGLACTEICCDSAFSLKLLPLLSKVDSYYFSNEFLSLSGENELNIRLKNPE